VVPRSIRSCRIVSPSETRVRRVAGSDLASERHVRWTLFLTRGTPVSKADARTSHHRTSPIYFTRAVEQALIWTARQARREEAA
jgi:hypothetical protein